jgi:hypothetical protein
MRSPQPTLTRHKAPEIDDRCRTSPDVAGGSRDVTMDCVEPQTAEDDAVLTESVPTAVLAAADRAKAEARKISDDRRASRRVSGQALGWINVARVKYGPEVNIVDLSAGGVLLESDRPLKPGSRQALEIAGPADRSVVVPFGVLRSRISALAPQGAVYRAACAFSRPLELPELAEAVAIESTATSAVPTAPAVEPKPAAPEPLMGTILREVPAPPAPAVEPKPAAPEPLMGTILREVPAPPAPAVEPKPAAPESLMDTILREVAAPPGPAVGAGWQKVVARFVDGNVLKGYSRDFDITRPSFSIVQSPECSDESVSVPLGGLKAVFFVRDFEGNSGYRERKTFMGQTHGRRVHLAFSDGEMIIGTTEGYRAGGTGFFVTPVDPRANNVRIFVVSTAVRQVRFP